MSVQLVVKLRPIEPGISDATLWLTPDCLSQIVLSTLLKLTRSTLDIGIFVHLLVHRTIIGSIKGSLCVQSCILLHQHVELDVELVN